MQRFLTIILCNLRYVEMTGVMLDGSDVPLEKLSKLYTRENIEVPLAILSIWICAFSFPVSDSTDHFFFWKQKATQKRQHTFKQLPF